MRAFSVFIFLLWLVPPAAGQAAERVGVQTVVVAGARVEALGGAGVALPGVWARVNPATLAKASYSVRLYGDQGFGLPELRSAAIDASATWRSTGLGLGAQTLGFDAFRVSALHVGAGRGFRLGTQRTVAAGLSATLHHAQIRGYGSGIAVALDVGFNVDVLPSLAAAATVRNLNQALLAGLEPVPQTLAVGLAYDPGAHLSLVLDVVDDSRFPLSVRSGAELRPVEAVALRIGVSTDPTTFSGGAGVRLGSLRADLAATRHEVLGWTPAVEVGLTW